MDIQLLWAGTTALLMAVLPQGLNPARLPASDPVPAGGLGSGLDWDLLWAGTWKSGGNLTNRADLGFHLSGPGLTLRAEVLDRRPGDSETLFHRFPWEVEDALTQVLAGLYHDSTGSRILYGPLEEWGLAARLRNPWSRSLPFAESHRASLVDLRTVPSAKAPELYLYLGSPFVTLPGQGGRGPELRVSAALRLDPARLGAEPGDSGALFPLGEGTALNTSLELRPGKTTALSLEGFYTAASLPARESSGWFSQPPPLPPQRFSLYGAGLLVTTTYLSLSADLARSRTSIMGGDLYASLGLRAGNRGSGGLSRPGGDWQLSLAVDGAGRNYTGSDGASPGAGFRTGGKFEWRHSRAGLFRINSTVSGPGLTWGGALRFNRSSSGLSYRPPATALPLRLSRISLGADRDAGDGGTVKDSAAVSLGVTANPRGIGLTGTLALNFSGSLTGSPAGDWAGGDREPSPWPVPGGPYRFESFKIAGDLSWLRPLSSGAKGTGRRSLRLKAGLDYTVKAPAPEEDFTKSRNFEIQAVLSGDRDRIGVTLSSSAFPWEIPSPAWELGLSWKVER